LIATLSAEIGPRQAAKLVVDGDQQRIRKAF
jgi:hypothetical protein